MRPATLMMARQGKPSPRCQPPSRTPGTRPGRARPRQKRRPRPGRQHAATEPGCSGTSRPLSDSDDGYHTRAPCSLLPRRVPPVAGACRTGESARGQARRRLARVFEITGEVFVVHGGVAVVNGAAAGPRRVPGQRARLGGRHVDPRSSGQRPSPDVGQRPANGGIRLWGHAWVGRGNDRLRPASGPEPAELHARHHPSFGSLPAARVMIER
jgi:hypothetical protein